MKKFTALLLTLITILSSVALTSCGEEKYTTLEEFFNTHPEGVAAVEEELKQVETDSMTVKASFEDNCCVITYKYKDTLDDDMVSDLSKGFESQESIYADVCKTSIADMEKNTEISGITMKIVYLNGDDKEIWSKEFENK